MNVEKIILYTLSALGLLFILMYTGLLKIGGAEAKNDKSVGKAKTKAKAKDESQTQIQFTEKPKGSKIKFVSEIIKQRSKQEDALKKAKYKSKTEAAREANLKIAYAAHLKAQSKERYLDANYNRLNGANIK